MNTQLSSIHSRKAQLGVTVIELMVALLLGILLTGGAIQVFVSNRATYGFNEGFARLQENGRFALDTMSYHARLAGYLGCLSNVPRYNNLEDATELPYDFEVGVGGYEADGTNPGQTFQAGALDPANSTDENAWDPMLPPELDGNIIPGSDVLVVRHASTVSHTLLSPFTTADEVTAVADVADYSAGDIAIVSDCQKASIFQITSVAAAGSGIEIAHVGSGTPGNDVISWTTDEQYAAGAQLARGETWVFYVGARAGGPPALFQQRLLTDGGATSSTLVAEELVEAVETMQVRYGIDAAQDGTIDSYVTANSVANWDQVATVRVSLVARSPEEYGTEVDDNDAYVVDETIFDPIDDRRLRQVFTTTIAIRNRLP